MPRSRGAWIAIAVFASVLILAGFWFIGVSPQRTEMADVESQRTRMTTENDALDARVAKLRAEFAKIDDYRAELAGLQVHLPTRMDDKGVFDRLTALAETHEVEVVLQSADVPTSLLGQIQAEAQSQAAAADAAKAAAGGEATSTGSDEPAPAPTKAPPEGWAAATVDDLVAVPVALTISGAYDAVRGFVADVRGTPDRYLLVGAPTFTFDDSGEEEAVIKAELTVFSFAFTDTAAELAARLEAEAEGNETVYPDDPRDPFGTHDQR